MGHRSDVFEIGPKLRDIDPVCGVFGQEEEMPCASNDHFRAGMMIESEGFPFDFDRWEHGDGVLIVDDSQDVQAGEFICTIGIGELGLAEGNGGDVFVSAMIEGGHQQGCDRASQAVTRHPDRAGFVQAFENPWQAFLQGLVEARMHLDSEFMFVASDKVQIVEDVLQVGGAPDDDPLRLACSAAVHVNPQS